MQYPPLKEIVKRLKTKQVVRFTRVDVVYEFTRIHASEARDYDGTPCNWSKTDPRNPIQLKITRDGNTRYTNYW